MNENNYIEDTYGIRCQSLGISLDIFQHLPVLRKYAEECDTIVEFGVRLANSTIAFLSTKPKKMISIDIQREFEDIIDEISAATKETNIDYTFILADSRTFNIPETDLLFIDTEHTAEQLRAELLNAAHKVKKYMIFHDTVTFPELYPVLVDEFLPEHPEWTIKEHLTNNNGLTVLMRI
jgi:TPP-dependent 2-oxoacid decarboxylase